MIDSNRPPKPNTRDSDGYLTEGQPEEEEELEETEVRYEYLLKLKFVRLYF